MKSVLLITGFVLAAAVFLLGIDRLLLWMEKKGWIYYRKKSGSPGTTASAFMQLQSMIEPGKKHVIEYSEQEYEEEDGEAGPDDPELGYREGTTHE